MEFIKRQHVHTAHRVHAGNRKSARECFPALRRVTVRCFPYFLFLFAYIANNKPFATPNETLARGQAALSVYEFIAITFAPFGPFGPFGPWLSHIRSGD